MAGPSGRVGGAGRVPGPDAYITPSWYATKRETGKVVPTWNYLMVQARGAPRVVETRRMAARANRAAHPASARRAAKNPGPSATRRRISSPSRCARSSASKFRFADLRGKWKASQNRNEADRAGVIEGLSETGDPMAEIVREFRAAVGICRRTSGGATLRRVDRQRLA